MRTADNGNVRVAFGELGNLYELDIEEYFAKNGQAFGFTGTEEFSITNVHTDEQDLMHIRIQQHIRGVEVIGGDFYLHVKPDGTVFGFTGSYLVDSDHHEYTKFNSFVDLRAALRAIHEQGHLTLADELDSISLDEIRFVVLLDENNEGAYAIEIKLDVIAEDGETRPELWYIDAKHGALLMNVGLHFYGLSRDVYNTHQTTSLPGDLVATEDDCDTCSSDVSVEGAYENSGVCWGFYQYVFNRDSLNGKGMLLKSTVNYGKNYNNAYFTSQLGQMVYGNGDGKIFSNFAGDLSVVCHELTHGVTSFTANLRYFGQSGALNEGTSDIMGASCVIWNEDCKWSVGKTEYEKCDTGDYDPSQNWMIGSECYVAGPALRYMNNPPLDGSSRDYFPDRYTGLSDNGGVHWNSGIANLFFVLYTQGGSHPQQKTNIFVNGVGIKKARQLWYVSLANYMTSTTDFADTLVINEQVASILNFPNEARSAIVDAWNAVGVTD
eukprot:CAMPEP_0201544932 /NCGR_PEP_ID=MMETSP0173_2-20130828/1544_1 /ASSEMBLY_ACC=CAM_ASM_000268 /TAXON_ID=218659 /ORGANISM="Vexillifera sp., Strain DIVA3 564/2" /LENGTH=493 /DNA_ID=CAMNT_0047953223 /DNA_START=148 /DNA_END=1629 /DNA_ORIENTATION=-